MGIREILFILFIYGAYKYVVEPLLQTTQKTPKTPPPPPQKTPTSPPKKTPPDDSEYIDYEEIKP